MDVNYLYDAISKTNDQLLKEKLPAVNIQEFIQKGSKIEHDDSISETVKAKFLYRLVREYRR